MSWLDNIPPYTGQGMQLGEKAGWKGADAGKHARHRRVHIRRGRAKEYPCARCSEYGAGRRALEWAQIHGTNGNDPWSDYLPLCRRCHFRYDGLHLGGVTSGSGSNAASLPRHRGERHPQHKLSEDEVLEIRLRLAGGEFQREIAESYGVSRSAISAISIGRTWGVS